MDTVEPTPAPAKATYINIVADIISAYVSNNSVPAHELATLIETVHQSIKDIETGSGGVEPKPELVPPVSAKKSITHEYLISMEDGKPYRSLRRHIGKHGLTPEEYRAKWGLPVDYPMVSPAYSAQRSALAKQSGLGSARSSAPKPVKLVQKEGRKGRGRPRKDAA